MAVTLRVDVKATTMYLLASNLVPLIWNMWRFTKTSCTISSNREITSGAISWTYPYSSVCGVEYVVDREPNSLSEWKAPQNGGGDEPQPSVNADQG